MAIAALAYVALGALSDSDPKRGPLATHDFLNPTDTAGAVSGDIVIARRTVTWRSVILTNPTNNPATIKRVTLLNAYGLRVIDARAAAEGRKQRHQRRT